MTPAGGPGARPETGRQMLACLSEGFCPLGHGQLAPNGGCGPCGAGLARTYSRPGCSARWRIERLAPEDTIVTLLASTGEAKARWVWPAGIWAYAGEFASRLVGNDMAGRVGGGWVGRGGR